MDWQNIETLFGGPYDTIDLPHTTYPGQNRIYVGKYTRRNWPSTEDTNIVLRNTIKEVEAHSTQSKGDYEIPAHINQSKPNKRHS